MEPFIVDKITTRDGTIIERNYPFLKGRVISEYNAKVLTDLLIDVIEEGTGKAAAVDGYYVAGKTGTSQKYIQGEGYSHSKFISSFIGYAPANDPQVLVLVVVDEPEGAYYGGQVAAPAFKNITEKTLRYLEVAPDRMRMEMAGLQSKREANNQ
jgi:cell division protein FtsI/penicillin-binding protein 2